MHPPASVLLSSFCNLLSSSWRMWSLASLCTYSGKTFTDWFTRMCIYTLCQFTGSQYQGILTQSVQILISNTGDFQRFLSHYYYYLLTIILRKWPGLKTNENTERTRNTIDNNWLRAQLFSNMLATIRKRTRPLSLWPSVLYCRRKKKLIQSIQMQWRI
jgi:hypothetical protein